MIRALAFDTETTAADPLEARLVTIYLGIVEPNGAVSIEQNWVVDSGVDIPEEAANIHGYSSERVRAEGRRDVSDVLREVLNIINHEARVNGLPVCGQNLVYDWTVIDQEMKRHGLGPLDLSGITVLDSLVLDKHADRFRRGNRKLTTMAEHYGIPISEDEAHTASFDAVAAARIIQALLQLPAYRGVDLRTLHERQITWHAEQAASLQAYLRGPKNKNGADPDAYVNPSWPLYGEVAA